MPAKQLSLDEFLADGPPIGAEIEYAPYHSGPGRPSPYEWVPALVVGKQEETWWPRPRPGDWDAKVTRIRLDVERQDRGKTIRRSCFVDHEGRTWRYPGSDHVCPEPY